MILAAAFLALVSTSPLAHQPKIRTKGVTFSVEVVVTPEAWQKGLMFREVLGKREGMLFFGKRVQPQSFWMKNTLIPLDIIFISKDLKVINIHHKTTPLSEKPLPSDRPALHVFEILGGVAQSIGLKAGDAVEFVDFPGVE